MTNPRDWDDAYANMAYVPGAETLPELWATQAAEYRASGVRMEELSYGDGDRQMLDLFWPNHTPRGLAVFVHGGYWMKFGKSDWSHFAAGAVSRGWAVCMPQYTLAPDARIAEMTGEVSAAISETAAKVAGPIRLAGHSAGGHLVSRMACDGSSLKADVFARVTGTISISGLHDLRPLLKTKLNDTLRMNIAEATAESAALQTPRDGANITAWVGGGERPEFIRQAKLLEMMWQGFDVDVTCTVDGAFNHFNVIDGLKDATSPLVNCWLGEAP